MRSVRAWAVLGVGAFFLAVTLTGCAAIPGAWFRPSKPMISIAASASCPAALGPARDVVDHSGESTTLLPESGAPSAVLVCSYTNRDLTAQTRLGSDAARQLASAVNKIDLTKPKGNFSCPAEFDSVTILAFRFGRTDDIDVWWSESGCQTLDNGRLGAFEGANPSFYKGFLDTYARLVPPTKMPAS